MDLFYFTNLSKDTMDNKTIFQKVLDILFHLGVVHKMKYMHSNVTVGFFYPHPRPPQTHMDTMGALFT